MPHIPLTSSYGALTCRTYLYGNDRGWHALRKQTRQTVLPIVINAFLWGDQQQQAVCHLGRIEKSIQITVLGADEGVALLESWHAEIC